MKTTNINTIMYYVTLYKIILCYNMFFSIGCHGHLPEAVRDVFFEINLNKKTLKLYTF